MTPYTYLLYCKPINKFYYGVKWKKGCHPDTFWVDYFTSSDEVQLLRTIFGDSAFKFEIRKTFKSNKKAAVWESKVLQRMKVLENQDVWLNKTTNSAWLYDVHPNQGKKMKSISDKMIGENNHRYGKKPWNYGLTKEDPRVANVSRKISQALKDRKNPDHSIRMKELWKSGIDLGMKNKKHSKKSNEKNRISHLKENRL